MTTNDLLSRALNELLRFDVTEAMAISFQMSRAEMSGTTSKDLAELSRSTSKWVRAAAAVSPRLPKVILEVLKRDPEPVVREAASRVFAN
jgi:hypothetical protein